MQCVACRREAVVFQPYSGKYLCPVHFTKDFEAKAKRAIRLHGWLTPGDHMGVVLTGDTAEAALLAFLHKLTKDRRDVKLSAIEIDEGPDGTGAARQVAEQCGVEVFPGSFAERYGITRDAIVRAEGDNAGRVCQVLAGDLAAEIAAAHGITRLAVATTVDDRALRFFSDLLSGTIEETLFFPETLGPARLPVIRPFMDIPGTEVYRYAEICGAGTGSTGTPGSSDAAAALAAYDAWHPATKFALANLAATLAGIATENRSPRDTCPACGSPRENGRCLPCLIRKKYNREPGS